MAQIDDKGYASHEAFEVGIRLMPDSQLLAQELIQQGAVNALAHLVRHGCAEEKATAMLASLRKMALLTRQKAARRGRQSLFDQDQTLFS